MHSEVQDLFIEFMLTLEFVLEAFPEEGWLSLE